MDQRSCYSNTNSFLRLRLNSLFKILGEDFLRFLFHLLIKTAEQLLQHQRNFIISVNQMIVLQKTLLNTTTLSRIKFAIWSLFFHFIVKCFVDQDYPFDNLGGYSVHKSHFYPFTSALTPLSHILQKDCFLFELDSFDMEIDPLQIAGKACLNTSSSMLQQHSI